MCYCARSCSAPCRDVILGQRMMALLITTITTMGIGQVETIRMLGGASARTTVRLLLSHGLEEVVMWSSWRGELVRGACCIPAVFGGRGQDRERGGSRCEAMTAIQAVRPKAWFSW